MNKISIIEKVKTIKIGREPMVVMPLKDWQGIEAKLEEYEMSYSQNYLKSIQEGRKQIKTGKLYELNLQTGLFKKFGKKK